MRLTKYWLAAMLLAACCLAPAPAPATDVDGGGDCNKAPIDFGDAPDGVLAYPGILGRFPTCTSAGPIGTQDISCAPISTAPGPTGYVKHVHFAADLQYWLGCFPLTGGGIDTGPDGKVNDTGGPLSACATGLGIDCVEAAFGMNFGQDECYGSSDAGIAAAVSFTACASSTVRFEVTNCATFPRQVFVNVLVDWNQDGDWNDNFLCGTNCAHEWVTKNVLILIDPGCTTQTTPAFTAGPRAGNGWMRVTISDNPVTDEFPWAGSAAMASVKRFSASAKIPFWSTCGPMSNDA